MHVSLQDYCISSWRGIWFSLGFHHFLRGRSKLYHTIPSLPIIDKLFNHPSHSRVAHFMEQRPKTSASHNCFCLWSFLDQSIIHEILEILHLCYTGVSQNWKPRWYLPSSESCLFKIRMLKLSFKARTQMPRPEGGGFSQIHNKKSFQGTSSPQSVGEDTKTFFFIEFAFSSLIHESNMFR